MSKKLTTDDFIEKSNIIHKGLYDYSKTNYKSNNENVIIICKSHGEFLQRAHLHKNGSGCPKCANILNGNKKRGLKESFVESAKIIHGDSYIYDKVIYLGSAIKVTILCPIHGDFKQTPSSHLNKNGCPTCGKEISIGKRKKWTYDSFKEAVQKLHPDLIFDKTNYIKPTEKILYDCPLHGEKEAHPYNLLKGCGCRNCSSQKPNISREKWLDRFKDCNCENISYNYIPNSFNSEEKITFSCSIHGEFKQTPLHHLKSCCPKCGKENAAEYHRKNPVGWSYTNWQKAGEQSEDFDSFKVYIIRCWNDNEEFFKIGKTFVSVLKRFRVGGKKTMPYNYEVINTERFKTSLEASKREKELQKLNKENKYLPKINFRGMYECFIKIN